MTNSPSTDATARSWALHKQPYDSIVDHEYSIFDGNKNVIVLLNSVHGHEDKLALIVEAVNAYEPLKARLAEVERERDDIRSTLNAWFNTSNKLEPDISKLLLDGLNGYIRRSESGGMPFELADDLRAVIEDFCRLYVGELLTPYIEQAKSSAESRIAVLVKALSDTLAQYVSMALSGDCGFWDPEEEPHVIAARGVLAVEQKESGK